MSLALDALLELGEVDRQLRRLERRIVDAARLSAPQQARVREAQAGLEEATDTAKRAGHEAARMEKEVQLKEGEIEKAQANLDSAKSNSEYQGLLKVIDQHQAKLGELETKVLEAYETQEVAQAKSAEHRKRLEQQQVELKAAEGRVAEEREAAEGERAGLLERREGLRAQIDPEHLQLYEAILERKGDSAVAMISDNHCQGCSLKIRDEQISRALGGGLVICTDCGRILYVER